MGSWTSCSRSRSLHVVADISLAVLLGEFTYAWFLFWPLVESLFAMPDYATIRAGTPYHDAVLVLKSLYVLPIAQVVLFLLGALAYLRDGAPGLEIVRTSIRKLSGMKDWEVA